jgi:hypothetical protein
MAVQKKIWTAEWPELKMPVAHDMQFFHSYIYLSVAHDMHFFLDICCCDLWWEPKMFAFLRGFFTLVFDKN